MRVSPTWAMIVAPPAQHQRRERGGHAGGFARARAYVRTSQRLRATMTLSSACDAPGVGRRVVVGEQAAHGVLRGLAAVGMAADAVGHGNQDALVLQLRAFRRDAGAIVLVARPRAGKGCVTEVDAENGGGFGLLHPDQLSAKIGRPIQPQRSQRTQRKAALLIFSVNSVANRISLQILAAVRCGPPGGAPARLDAGEPDQGQHGQRGEDQEAGLVAAGHLLRE
jgi:hypothetical protein